MGAFRWCSALVRSACHRTAGLRKTALALVFGFLPVVAAAQTAAPEIEPVRTTITVSEKIQTEAPTAIEELPREEIRRIPGVNLDDRLRTIPGFTLLRRTSSVVANPTTQGVSLRAVGSNGASRTLLLWDGIPVNDPFGSWVYWTRIAPEEIERIDVLRGSTSSVFGDRSLGGAISMFTRDPGSTHGRFQFDAGNLNTYEVEGSLSNVWRRASAYANVRAFSTDGYFIVPTSVCGPVDTPANSRFVAGATRVEFFSGAQRFAVKLDILAEERDNGTTLTHNSTSIGTLSGDYGWQHGNDTVSLRAFHTREQFHATFSSIGPGRKTERLTFVQSVPAEGTGGAGFYSHSFGEASILAGADFERDEGYSTDMLVPTGVRLGGGVRTSRAAFAQTVLKTGVVRWYGGVRENWITGGDRFFAPNGGFAVPVGRLRVRGSVYRAFRAPTLNELYREFRVGNTATLANPALRSETLFGAETGVDWNGENSRVSVTLFRNDLEGLITNVTLSATPTAITRQRQNAAAALSRGVEASASRRWRDFNADASWLYADARFSNGLRLPQIPKNQGNARLTWRRAATTISGGVISYSLQFEDDLNLFPLPGFATLQLYGRQALGHGVSAVASVENLLDRTYLAGFTPTPVIGAPRLWRVGFRWEGR